MSLDDERPAFAGRLERVRRWVDARTLREFYNELGVAEVEGFPSYASARTYHFEPWRTPSLPYLEAIVRRYPGVSVRWLNHGIGDMTDVESQLRSIGPRLHEGLTGLQESFAGLQEGLADDVSRLQEIVRSALGNEGAGIRQLQAIEELTMTWQTYQGTRGYDVEDNAEIVEALAAPLRALGVAPAAIRPKVFGHYVRAMSELLEHVLTQTPRQERKPQGGEHVEA